jgi:MULE transposase domain.
MPVAWMISSNATEATINFFLRTVKGRNPAVKPKWFMSDKDRAQLNSIRSWYPDSKLLLCWWHVLHAWQQHFVTAHHPKLWDLLKTWVRITDMGEFDKRWTEIQSIAPPSVIQYLKTEWLGDRDMWSAVTRMDRTIFEQGDTNMLIEACVSGT